MDNISDSNRNLETNTVDKLNDEPNNDGLYKHFFEHSKDLACVADMNGFFKLISPSFVSLLGYSEEELLSKPFTAFIHPDDLQHTREEYQDNSDGKSSHDFENRYVKKDGGLVTLQWRSTSDKKNGFVYAIARDITQQKQLEFELRNKQELLNASQSVAKLGSFSYNTVDYSLFWSDELYNIFAITVEERNALYDAYVSRFDQEGLELYTKVVGEAMKSGERYSFQHKVYIPNGRIKTVSCVGIPFMDENGKVYRIDGVVQDITEQIENEEIILNSVKEKELLIKELHHRVKNNLQVISSLLNLQSNLEMDSTLQLHLKECQNRIKSMASIHDMLYRSQDITNVDFTAYTKQLISDLMKSYLGSNYSLNLKLRTDDITLNLDSAVPMGLLINEIVTNSLKHAYRPNQEFELSVSIDKTGDGFIVKVGDNGPGYDTGSVDKRSTLGLMIIDTLTEQLEAKHVVQSNSNGTTHSIQVSLCAQ